MPFLRKLLMALVFLSVIVIFVDTVLIIKLCESPGIYVLLDVRNR